MLEQKQITIGENDFEYFKMNSWDANLILIQLKGLITPAMRKFKPEADEQGKPKPMSEQPVMGLVAELLDGMTEEFFESFTFKLFNKTQVVCTNKKSKILNPQQFSTVFDGADGLVGAYQLLFNILVEHYSGFFMAALDAYGARTPTENSISIPMKLAQ